MSVVMYIRARKLTVVCYCCHHRRRRRRAVLTPSISHILRMQTDIRNVDKDICTYLLRQSKGCMFSYTSLLFLSLSLVLLFCLSSADSQ